MEVQRSVSPVFLTFALIAAFSCLVVALELAAMVRHLRGTVPALQGMPGVSVLKPLCGRDDDLEQNLVTMLEQDYANFEVLFGVRDERDAAYPVACAVAARAPDRARIVLQRGEPGYNPKVNQLITLAAEAKHDLLIINDSNIRVRPGYVRELAALMQQPGIGLATNLFVGVGEEAIGSHLDNSYIAGHIAPGIVAGKVYLRQDLVVGKSMAVRKSHLGLVGGFEAFRNILAEDWMIAVALAKKGLGVALSPHPVLNVSRRATFRQFFARYARWCVIQRQGNGLKYFLLVLLFPIPFALVCLLAAPSLASLGVFAGACLWRTACDAIAARVLRPPGFGLGQLLLVPLRELVCFAAYGVGAAKNTVVWRGTRLRVTRGTVLAPVDGASPGAAEESRPGGAVTAATRRAPR